MTHIQTYEGMFNKFFKNDFVNKIANGLLHLFKLGKFELKDNFMIYDFILHKYLDNNTILFYTAMSQSGDVKDSILKIKFEGQWLIVDVGTSSYFKLKELQYFMHLLKLYGEKTHNTIKTSNGIDEYFLTLENADKLIKELTPEGMSDYAEIQKYNL